MKKPTLLKRFSFLCLTTLLIFGFAFSWIGTTYLERNMVSRANRITAAIVLEEMRREFVEIDLINPKIGPDYDTFSERVKHLSLGPDIQRIKVWNKNKSVVWSDDRRLVGQQFPDNKDLALALAGEVVSDIKKLEKPEHKFERQFRRLLELYVPIRFDPEGDIETVLEVYQNLDPLYSDITGQKRIIWFSTILGIGLLFLVLFQIVKNASNQIEIQTRTIMESEERYRSLIQSAQDGIISIDPTGKVILFNKAAEMIFGCSTEDIIGQPLTLLIPEEYRDRHVCGLTLFLETKKPTFIGKTFEVTGLQGNGQTFPMELSLSVSGKKEQPVITGILRDVSERKTLQAQLIEAERQASVSLVAGSIGHELNNSITSLVGYADLLGRNPEDTTLAQECGEIFSNQCQRLKQHAQNLLSLSKPRQPELKPFSFHSLLDKVTELLLVSGVLNRYKVVKEYSGEFPPVLGDEMLLEQVIRNLEINAAHAMGDQGILTLNMRSSEDRSHVEFSVADTGHGIPEDKRDQIFLPFYTTKEKGKGTGLGMYIVKQIIEQHKGYIQLKSEVGMGTTISIGLPMPRVSTEFDFARKQC